MRRAGSQEGLACLTALRELEETTGRARWEDELCECGAVTAPDCICGAPALLYAFRPACQPTVD